MKHYVEEVRTVIFRKSWSPIFESYSNEDAGKLIKALYQFMNGEEPEIYGPMRGAYLMMANQIEDSAYQYWKKVCQDEEE